jgi:hypothetical protein
MIPRWTAKDWIWTPENAAVVPTLWIDASDASTRVMDGSSVASIQSKSPNRAIFSASGTNRPTTTTINGLTALDFDGSNDYLNAASLQLPLRTRSFFIVARQDTNVNNSGIFSLRGTTYDWCSADGLAIECGAKSTQQFSIVSLVFDGYGIGAGYEVQVQPGAITPLAVYAEVFSSRNGELWQNGTSKATDYAGQSDFSSVSYGGVVIGARYGPTSTIGDYLNGAICEILYSNSATSTDERQRFEGYLAHKWGLTGDLPSNHPYKTYAPRL